MCIAYCMSLHLLHLPPRPPHSPSSSPPPPYPSLPSPSPCSNNECPSCRAHCASRRSLRSDPRFDALVAAVFPNRDRIEKEVRRRGKR
ncbi:unnamed protein product, partial [Closterium sp. NIES-54]